MGKDNVFDVIVVGAGPAGTTASLVLAQAGLNVVHTAGTWVRVPEIKNVFAV